MSVVVLAISGKQRVKATYDSQNRGKVNIKITHIMLSLTLFLAVTRAYHDLIVFLVFLQLAISCRISQVLYCCGPVVKTGNKKMSSVDGHTLFSKILHSFIHISCIIPVLQEPLYLERQHGHVL